MRMFTSCLDGSPYCYQITEAEIELEGKAVTVYGIHIYKDGCKHSHCLLESCLIEDVSDELGICGTSCAPSSGKRSRAASCRAAYK